MSAVGIVGHRPRVPDQARGFLDLDAWKPANRLDSLRRVAPTEPGIKLESRVAHDLSLARGDAVFAVQREAGAVAVVTARACVIWHQPCRGRVPGEDAARIAGRLEITLGQKEARVGADQVRAVAPISNEVS